METTTCETCKHFRFHYVRFGYRYSRIRDGHCVYPRSKRRESETPACKHYKQREEARPG